MQSANNPRATDPPRDAAATEAEAPRAHHAGLYILPALIVLVFVAGWLFVFWLLHEDQDPQSLVQGMRQPDRRSWQKAYALSQLLLDPDHDHLKDDAQLCRALTDTLVQQNRQAAESHRAGEAADEELAQFRAFLCRALGEFRLLDSLPALTQCATAETPPDAAQGKVRLAAIEAIAVLANNADARRIQAHPETVERLVQASQEAGTAEPDGGGSQIASAATFALGVIGGPQATGQLLTLIDDPRPDVRYNAAAGLARQGRPEAVPVLLEMLDPTNRTAAQHERTESARMRKQLMVLNTGIQAAVQSLATASPDLRQQLITALEQLRDSEAVTTRVRIDAKEALLRLDVETR